MEDLGDAADGVVAQAVVTQVQLQRERRYLCAQLCIEQLLAQLPLVSIFEHVVDEHLRISAADVQLADQLAHVALVHPIRQGLS
ncbi:hypothetical protein D3C77_272370 [compost metagenome]